LHTFRFCCFNKKSASRNLRSGLQQSDYQAAQHKQHGQKSHAHIMVIRMENRIVTRDSSLPGCCEADNDGILAYLSCACQLFCFLFGQQYAKKYKRETMLYPRKLSLKGKLLI